MKTFSMISRRWLLLAAFLIVACNSREAHASAQYDIEVYKIDVKDSAAGNKTFQEGEIVPGQRRLNPP